VSDADHVQDNVRGLMVDARITVRVGDPSRAQTSIELATAKKSVSEWIRSPDPELHVVAGTTEHKGSKLTIAGWGAGHVTFETATAVKGELALEASAGSAVNVRCR